MKHGESSKFDVVRLSQEYGDSGASLKWEQAAISALSGIPDPQAYVRAVEALEKAVTTLKVTVCDDMECAHCIRLTQQVQIVNDALAALRRVKGESTRTT